IDKLNIKFPPSNLKELNSNYVFLALLVFFITVLFLAIGSSMDIYVSNFFYLGDQQFVLQNYFVLTIFFRKILLPLIVLYLLILPIISVFFPIEKIYFNTKLKTKDVLFIFGSVVFNLLVFVNFILKNMWGRARPNDIVELGGKENFTPWFELSEACNVNCSFVSGDAAVGFSLIVLFFVTRNKIFYWGSLVAGFSIGLIRIIEGGHFFSDIIMAGLIVYLLTYIQFYFFKKKYAN
ncbi:phosphatase PAP2 family protein, partial [Alphaproteobacteria bacterium]|nr:phosphatase PAP2 family protein [Alphaproteobacteria bacterium]